MKALVGLGNPGPRYAETRHNLGYRVADAFGFRHGVRHFRAEGDVLEARVDLGPTEVLVVKPRTYMNESGRAVRALVARHALAGEDLVVAHDDLDLDLGVVRIKRGGGDGGHNGLRSIVAETGDAGFVRIRLGIRRPEPRQDAAEWVLAPFAPEEGEAVRDMVDRGADAALAVLRVGAARAMNQLNRRRSGDGGIDPAVAPKTAAGVAPVADAGTASGERPGAGPGDNQG